MQHPLSSYMKPRDNWNMNSKKAPFTLLFPENKISRNKANKICSAFMCGNFQKL